MNTLSRDAEPVERPARRRRWLGWVVLAVLAVWLVATTVNQVITGSFWLGGIPNPLVPLLFFAGPPVVLAAVVALAIGPTGLRGADRTLLACALGTLLLVVLHLLLAGHTWLWIVPDLMPPVLFVLLPVASLVAAGWLLARRSARPAVVAGAVVAAVAALVLGFGQSGVRVPGSGSPAPAGALHVVSWDTLDWHSGRAFYAFLTAQHADVYLLQDYVNDSPDDLRPARDTAALHRAFPGYHFATAGDLLTISRFPFAATQPLLTNPVPPAGTGNVFFLPAWKYAALRTDIVVGGRTVSLYNVHLYDRYYLNVLPLTPTFFRDVRGLAAGRTHQIDELTADIAADPHGAVVAGNFNVLPGTGELQRFDGLRNADTAGGSVYPATLTFFGLSLWQVDWTFTSRAAAVHSYHLVSPDGLSSHHLQDLVVTPS